MIKLIASDMDGTLLDAHVNVSPENAEAIHFADDAGVEFMVATGRNYQEARATSDEVGIDCAMITLNKVQVFDKEGDSLFTVSIPNNQATSVLSVLDANGIYYEVATNDSFYSENRVKRIESSVSMAATHLPHLTYKMAITMASTGLGLLYITYVDSIRTILEEKNLEVLKIICFHTEGPAVLGPVGKQISLLGDLAVTSSGQNNTGVNHKNAQKGIAVTRVARERGASLEEVVMIDDNFDDVSMLQVAGVGFVMGNVEIEVRDYVEYAADTNLESGVGKTILRAVTEDL